MADMEDEAAAAREDAAGHVLRAAARLGVDIDHDEAKRWIAAMSAESSGSVTVDVDTGVYGHRVTMADHDPAELERFRRIAAIVALEDRPPQVVTALALSGSAAQNRIHRFPADVDFFQRVHLRIDTQQEAGVLLSEVIRDKALATMRGVGYRLQEVKFGNWPENGTVDGKPIAQGNPISWAPGWVEVGHLTYHRADGTPVHLTWQEVAHDPGWCKLDWILADAGAHGLVNVSNVLDPTWEAPDGWIVALDGFLDPYFQEVYLDTGSLPVFSRLVKEMGADAVAEYVERLTGEVFKYTVEEPNHGKAARRLYNVFRITGRYDEAAYVRELFDEPVTALYQLAGLLRALDEVADAADVDGAFAPEAMVSQVDRLIMAAIVALDGPAEAEMVRGLLDLRDALSGHRHDDDRSESIAEMRRDALTAVNAYFEQALTEVPSIRHYLDGVAATHGTGSPGTDGRVEGITSVDGAGATA
jgi:hypothetical protein